MSIPDVYDLWEAHERDQERQLSKRPVCGYCDQSIQDDFYFEIEGETTCESCLNKHFKKNVSDHID